MTLTVHNLVKKTDRICFAVWSKKGTGMVNVFTPGDTGGEMMSVENARKYYASMVECGYVKSEDTTLQCC